ncbi:hypothetical protein SK128_025854 [Halocaridina rubra]|uniref:Chitin-binding type-2 domain-containing protein n=1 Tax=Halocaridina rubra TaxID=373956 RepID=A0AAN8XIS5_HALRR
MGNECEPDCTGYTGGHEVVDPRNCTQFNGCMPGQIPSDKPFSCAPGMEFQENIGFVPAYGCKPICKVVLAKLITAPSVAHQAVIHSAMQPPYRFLIQQTAPNSINVILTQFTLRDHALMEKCLTLEQAIVIQVQNVRLGAARELQQALRHQRLPCQQQQHLPLRTPSPVTTFITNPKTKTTTTPNDHNNNNNDDDNDDDDTTTPPFPEGCMDTGRICEEPGFFAKCNTYCVPQYYFCEAAGVTAIVHTCPEGLVFNPNPNYPYCIQESSCPYKPPRQT